MHFLLLLLSPLYEECTQIFLFTGYRTKVELGTAEFPVMPVAQEDEAGGSPEPRSLMSAWAA